MIEQSPSSATPYELPPLGFEASVLAPLVGSEAIEVNRIAGDGSDRQYFRLKSTAPQASSQVLMVLNSTLDKEALNSDQYHWTYLSKFLSHLKLKTPKVIAVLKKQGAILIEDFGDTTLDLVLSKGPLANTILKEVFGILKVLAKSGASATLIKAPFDAVTFRNELEFFKEKFLFNHLGLSFDKKTERLFTKETLDLCHYLQDLPMCLVHRDFHSRNLMLLPGSKVGILDFQDARLGPIPYDLVSFVFDSYLGLDLTKRQELLHLGLLELKAVLAPNVFARVQEAWPAVLLQRQLKALGSFAFLENEKKRGRYLRFVPEGLKTLGIVQSKRWSFLSKDLLLEMKRCSLS